MQKYSIFKKKLALFLCGLANALCQNLFLSVLLLWCYTFTCGFLIAGTLSGFPVAASSKEAAAEGDDLEVVWSTGIWTI